MNQLHAPTAAAAAVAILSQPSWPQDKTQHPAAHKQILAVKSAQSHCANLEEQQEQEQKEEEEEQEGEQQL